LTASEISGLNLNADWVVLSACNTMAGDHPGGEALSGLARAFFYAGARALLVTHWSVQSAAAARIAARTFQLIAEHPGLPRDEALQRAMLEMIDSKSPGDEWSAYPGVWAAFTLVGDNRALSPAPSETVH